MAAIITDQVRILNAKNFVAGIANADNSYYSFVGLPNPTDYSSTWNDNPPSPKDNFDEENDYWNTMIAMKRINSTDVRQVIPRRSWSSGKGSCLSCRAAICRTTGAAMVGLCLHHPKLLWPAQRNS